MSFPPLLEVSLWPDALRLPNSRQINPRKRPTSRALNSKQTLYATSRTQSRRSKNTLGRGYYIAIAGGHLGLVASGEHNAAVLVG